MLESNLIADGIMMMDESIQFQHKLEFLAKAEHNLQGKTALIPRVSLRSHFDSIRDIKFCQDDQLLVSVSEDCMMKLWDVKQLKKDEDHQQEALYTYRGHTGPLFALATNHGLVPNDTLIFSAGLEGVIRVWKLPEFSKDRFPPSDGKNHCVGVFSSHKDVVWQLVHHPQDNMLLSVSADASVKLWKSIDLAA